MNHGNRKYSLFEFVLYLAHICLDKPEMGSDSKMMPRRNGLELLGADSPLATGAENTTQLYLRCFSEGKRTLSYRLVYHAPASASEDANANAPVVALYPTLVEGTLELDVVEPLLVASQLLSPYVF